MIKTLSNGLLSSNVHVFWDEDTKEAMIIDCGVPTKSLIEIVNQNSLEVKYIILTHGHYDHAHFVNDYHIAFPLAKVVCHENEIKVLTDEDANVSSLVGIPETYVCDYTTVNEGDILSVGRYDFAVLHTPGHTPGCICLYSEKEKLMFTGDVLFDNGIGRTDFKYGNISDMRSSLSRLLSMDGEILFYPGHYGCSKLGYQ